MFAFMDDFGYVASDSNVVLPSEVEFSFIRSMFANPM